MGRLGLEPRTCGLKVRYSAIELATLESHAIEVIAIAINPKYPTSTSDALKNSFVDIYLTSYVSLFEHYISKQ